MRTLCVVILLIGAMWPAWGQTNHAVKLQEIHLELRYPAPALLEPVPTNAAPALEELRLHHSLRDLSSISLTSSVLPNGSYHYNGLFAPSLSRTPHELFHFVNLFAPLADRRETDRTLMGTLPARLRPPPRQLGRPEVSDIQGLTGFSLSR